MDALIFYLELGGLYVQLLRRRGWHEPEPLLVVHRGRLLDHDTEVLRAGMELERARQRVPGARVVPSRALPVKGPWQLLARTVYRHTPRIERRAPHRLFALPGANREPERFFGTLCENLIPGAGRRLLGAAAPSRLLAGLLARLWLAGGRLPASWQEHVRVRSCCGGAGCLLLLSPVVWRRHGAALIEQAPVGWLWPLAAAEKAFLARRGIARCGELQRLPRRVLVKAWGARAADAARTYARGRDPEPFQSNYPPARVQATLTLPTARPLDGGVDLREIHRQLVGRLQRRLIRSELACRRLSCSLRSDGGVRVRRRRCFSLPRPGAGSRGARGSSSPGRPRPGGERELAAPAWALLQEAAAALVAPGAAAGETGPVLLVQVALTADRLVPRPSLQLTLLNPTGDEGGGAAAGRSGDQLETVLADLQQRFPARAIDRGRRLKTPQREEMLGYWDPLRQTPAGRMARS